MKPEIKAEIRQVECPEVKAAIAEQVLQALPDWFGLPKSTREYIEQARSLPFYAAFVGGQAIGFATRKDTSAMAAEVHCMGVLPRCHRRGIGQALMALLEQGCKTDGLRLLQVKTVDQGHYPETYDKTIAFYEKMGFIRLEVFPEMWDPWNPCLVLVKPL